MIYIFNFRYKPSTSLEILDKFIDENKLKWKSRKVELNNDIAVKFVLTGDFDINYDFKKIRTSGIIVDSIEVDNGKYISAVKVLLD